MRKGPQSFFGCAAIAAGIVIILSLVLPVQFWWFILAAALIYIGVWYVRCR